MKKKTGSFFFLFNGKKAGPEKKKNKKNEYPTISFDRL